MNKKEMDKQTNKIVLAAQKTEITEYYIYSHLAQKVADHHNKAILQRIAHQELQHYHFWKKITQQEMQPRWWSVRWYFFLTAIFGLSFALKLMERKELLAKKTYEKLLPYFPQVKRIQQEENRHEKILLGKLAEKRIQYAGSLVLGLNDALVELTGALAGLTLALRDSTLIAISGLVVGIAASLSMAASAYLSAREEESHFKNPFKSAIYTGVAYLATVALLVVPYFIFSTIYLALAVMLGLALCIIFGYTFYITTAKSLPFWKRFLEMALISITVAIVSFGVGYALKGLAGIMI